MSTRATYQFTGARSRGLNHSMPTVTVYIHHDGYPEGAACYFWNMHHVESYDRAPLTCFLRANERAELTEGHEAHGDTEFRYTVREDDGGLFVTAYAGKWPGGDGPRTWSVFFVGTVAEFINKYGPGSFFEGFEPLRVVPVNYCEGYGNRTETLSRGQIVKRLEAARGELDSYKARFPDAIGNIRGHESTVRQWERALTAYDAQGAAPAVAAS